MFEYHPRDEHLFDGVTIPEPESLFEDKSHRSVASRDFGSTVSGRGKGRCELTKMIKPDHPTGQLDITGMTERQATEAAYQKYLKDYLRTVKAVDDNVGRLLDYLEAKDLLDDTLIVYSSDQGMFLGEHDYNDKRWIYTEALQMPLLARYPREVKPGTVVDSVISNIHFAPTFLDYAGLSPESSMPGRSFRAILRGERQEDWPNIVYYRYWMHLNGHDNPAHIGICDGRYKLIFFYGLPLDASGAVPQTTPPGWELYDLEKDPEELRNVHNDPEYAAVADAMKTQLFAIKEETGDVDTDPEMLRRIAETP
jgi:arylsulfatase A-like enzyme